MQFPEDFYEFLSGHNHVGIKGGNSDHSFLKIWMVVVDKRVFARSWGRNKRSWFTAFQKSGIGQLQYGDRVMEVKGRKTESDPALTHSINMAYRERYREPENIPYVRGITRDEYADYTMEFFFQRSE